MQRQVENTTLVLGLAQNHVHDLSDISKFTDSLASSTVSVIGAIDSLLACFVRCNFLGPKIEELTVNAELEKVAIERLSVDGETPYSLAKLQIALWLSKSLSYSMLNQNTQMTSEYALLYLECLYLHQCLFGPTRVPTLKSELDWLLAKVNPLDLPDTNELEKFTYLQLSSYLAVFYYEFALADKLRAALGHLISLELDFTAAMGTRTKAQTNPVAQLLIRFTRLQIGCELRVKLPKSSHPKVMALEDDNLLENIKFTDDTTPGSFGLSVVEQSYVLNWCEIHKRSHPNDDLTKEQCLTLVNSVIMAASSHSSVSKSCEGSSWPVLTEALFKRSPLEQRSFARLERALCQLEELTAQFSRATPPVEDRGLQHFFLARMPSIWMVEMEYARVLASFGSLKAALDVYLRWEMWDDAITAYTLLGQPDLAEQCIRDRIAHGDETPDLYCSLGDVTKDPAHYEKAWELSNHKSARAMKALGLRSLTVDKDLSKAAEYLEKSLLINRFQINLWFTLGCCHLQLKNFSKAESAFRTCVNLEPDNFEAWNNLASAVIFSGRKAAALELLKEATKWNYENWRIWENILLASIDVAAFGETIRAYHRLIDLRERHVDPQILAILVRAVCENRPDKEGHGASRYRAKLLELMGRATSTAPSDADTWRHYATLLLDDCDQSKPSVFQRAVQCLQKSYQCRLKSAQSGWELVAKTRSATITDLRALHKLLMAEKEFICGEEVAKKEEEKDGATAAGDKSTAPTDPEETPSNLVQLAFLHSSLSTLRLNINSLISRLKKAGEYCVDPTVTSDLNPDIETLKEMLSSVTAALSDLPPV